MSAYFLDAIGGGLLALVYRHPTRLVVALFDDPDRALDALLDIRALEALPCVR